MNKSFFFVAVSAIVLISLFALTVQADDSQVPKWVTKTRQTIKWHKDRAQYHLNAKNNREQRAATRSKQATEIKKQATATGTKLQTAAIKAAEAKAEHRQAKRALQRAQAWLREAKSQYDNTVKSRQQRKSAYDKVKKAYEDTRKARRAARDLLLTRIRSRAGANATVSRFNGNIKNTVARRANRVKYWQQRIQEIQQKRDKNLQNIDQEIKTAQNNAASAVQAFVKATNDKKLASAKFAAVRKVDDAARAANYKAVVDLRAAEGTERGAQETLRDAQRRVDNAQKRVKTVFTTWQTRRSERKQLRQEHSKLWKKHNFVSKRANIHKKKAKFHHGRHQHHVGRIQSRTQQLQKAGYKP